MEWELSKENVRPVKSGRSTKGLGLSALSIGGKNEDLVEQERQFEASLLGAHETDDPLGVYIRYFKWIRSTYPSDLSRTLSVLEKCTCALSGEEKYRNDIRFVKLWIEYADAVRTPGEIFSYMQSNKIGIKLSLFWIAWAFVTEKLENFKLTDQIFQKGISKHAEPKDVLQKRYQQFQRRMARHYLNLTASVDEAGSSSNRESSERGALSSLSASQGRGAQRAGGSRRERPRGLGNNPAGSHAAQSLTREANHNQASTGGFLIFDEATTGEDHGGGIDENAQWSHAPSEKMRHKENEGVPTFWNEAPLARSLSCQGYSSSATQQIGCPISIFADEGNEDQVEKPKVQNNGNSDRGLNDFGGRSVIDELAKDPLRRHREDHEERKKDKKTKKRAGKEANVVPVEGSVPPPQSIPAPVQIYQEATTKDVHGYQDEGHSFLQAADAEDVTINTKLAMKDIDSMFCSPGGDRTNVSMNSLGFSICEDGPSNTAARQNLSAAVHELSDICEASVNDVFALNTPTR